MAAASSGRSAVHLPGTLSLAMVMGWGKAGCTQGCLGRARPAGVPAMRAGHSRGLHGCQAGGRRGLRPPAGAAWPARTLQGGAAPASRARPRSAAADPPAAPLARPCPIVPHLQIRAGLPPGVDGWAMSLQGMMGLVVIGGLLITATYWLLNRTVVKKVRSRVLAAQLHRHEEGGAGCRGTLSFLRSFLLPVSSLSL